ncbi:MAG: hypothetical protein AAFX05_03615 [Planctomycetota bacterium]
MRSKRWIVGLSVAALGSVVLTGCGSGTSKHAFRLNPTPDLHTASQNADEINNRITITNDTNLRYFNEDLGRLFLLDRPSGLNKRGLFLY